MKRFGTILRAAVSALLILLLLYLMRDKYGEILNALKGTSMPVFCLAVLTYTGASLIASLRFKLIIEAQNIKIKLREAVSLTYIGFFFNNFLPTSIGGDVVKGHYLSKHSSDMAGSYTSVFVDRIAGMVTMVLMAFTALVFAGSGMVDKRVALTIYVITGLSVLTVFFLACKTFAKKFSALIIFVKPIEKQLRNLYTISNKYRHHTGLLWVALMMSIVSQLFYFATLGILAVSIGCRIPVFDLLLKMPLVSMVSLLPSINGLGVREGSTVVLFGPLIGRENALAVSILMILVLLVMSLAGGIIYAVSPQFKMKIKEIEEEGEKI